MAFSIHIDLLIFACPASDSEIPIPMLVVQCQEVHQDKG